MRKMTKDEQIWLNEYILNELKLDNADASDKMKMAIYNTFEFQKFLLKKNWQRLLGEIATYIRPVLNLLKIHK